MRLRDARLLAPLLAACAAAPAPDAPRATPPAASSPRPPEPAPSDSSTTPAPPADPAPSAAPSPVPSTSPTAPVPSTSPTAPVPSTSPPPADPPTPELLNKPRAALEARLGPPQSTADGWTRYADLDIQYRSGRSARVRRLAPVGLDCAAVATWAGFLKPVGHPLRRAGGCVWPGISDRHRLAPGLAASYDEATRQFEVGPQD